MTMAGDIASIGECMVEMAPNGDGLYRRGFAGDTLNTAWYLRALLPRSERAVRYVSAVGTDPLSEQMLSFMADNGIDTSAIARLADQTVGLYLITLNGAERSFSYWRSASAARQLAADRARLDDALKGTGLVYFSGITLAILPPDDRARLFSALEALRARGVQVAFDPNFRPRLWPDIATMAAVTTEGYRAATIALPTFPDDAEVYGDPSHAATIARIAALGPAEIIVKDGDQPASVFADGAVFQVASAPVPHPVDTTGAGDSFNGGYLAARASGKSPREAAAFGHAVAGRVICHRGALIDPSLVADLGTALQAKA